MIKHKRILASFLLLLLVGIALLPHLYPLHIAQSHTEAAPVQPQVLPLTVDNLLKEVNEERAAAHVAPLRIDPLLNKSAQMKADELKQTGVFSHIGPDGRHGYEYIKQVGVTGCSYMSENIAGGFYDSEKVFDEAWMISTAHREALLNSRYDTTGFGIAGGYVSEHFCDLP